MSAQEQMRKMLDELMGTRRNGEDTREDKLHFTNVRVCKNFLLNCCPHEILNATRGDMGQCKKVHDVALKADFENSNRRDEYAFQREALQQLKSFVAESERRTQFAKVRLAETQEILGAEEAARNINKQLALQKIRQIEEQITEKLVEAERLGAEGDVEGSLKMMEVVEALKSEKEEAENDHRSATPASITQQQKLRVCEVCTSYLGVHDNDRRLADHFNGKLHLGFITIREKLKDLEELVQDHHIKTVVSAVFEGGDVLKGNESHSHGHSKHQRSRSRSPERKHRHKSSGRESRSSHHKHKHRRHSRTRDHKRPRSSEKTSKPSHSDSEKVY